MTLSIRQGGLDNLLKGAATQCLQVSTSFSCIPTIRLMLRSDKNLNLALGYDEYAGIPID